MATQLDRSRRVEAVLVARSFEHPHDHTVLGSLRRDSPPVSRVADPADHVGSVDLDAFVMEPDTSRRGRLDPVVDMKAYAVDLAVEEDTGFVVQVAGRRGCLVGPALSRKVSAAGLVEEGTVDAGPAADIGHTRSFATAVRRERPADHRLVSRGLKPHIGFAVGSHTIAGLDRSYWEAAGHEHQTVGFGAIAKAEVVREAYTGRSLARTG